jgi:hypothetical protein
MFKKVNPNRFRSVIFCLFFFIYLVPPGNLLHAQELEPRLLSNIPLKSNVIALGYGYASGNILIDPSVPLDDFNAKMNSFMGAYARSVKFFDMSGKFDVIVPFVAADYTGTYNGNYEESSQTGFGDIRMRFSFNFFGAPPISLAEFKDYKPKIIMGFSAQVIAPPGDYDPSILPNLSSNRWTFKSQLGLAQHFNNKWVVEGYFSTWFFGANNNYLNGQVLKQSPLLGLKAHVIKTFSNRIWITADAGYAYGGMASVNDVKKEVTISSYVLGLSVAVPIARAHTLRLIAKSSYRILQGPDFDGVFLSYQYFWNRSN